MTATLTWHSCKPV